MARMRWMVAVVVLLVAGGAGAAVSSEVSQGGPYACGGVTFSAPFKFFSSSDLSVVVISAVGAESTLALGTDYTVAGAGGASGTVTLVDAARCPAFSTLVVKRSVPFTQPYVFSAQGPLSVATLGSALDRLAMQGQQLQREKGDATKGYVQAQVAGAAIGQVFAEQVQVKGLGSSTPRSLAERFADTVNVKDFGAKGDGVTDDTAALQAAVSFAASGPRELVLPDGRYLVSSPIVLPVSFSGGRIRGPGFSHWLGSSRGATLTTNTAGLASLIVGSSGLNNVTLSGLRIDGAGKAQIGIDATNIGFLTLEEVGVYGTTAYGAYIKQGLARIRRVFFGDYPTVSGGVMVQGAHANTGVGLRLYSDSTVSDSEFVGGTVPLVVASGGNAINNVWISDGTQACIRLSADAGTEVINTRITNSYLEQPHGGAVSTPIVDIVGLVTGYVQNTMISNTYFNGSVIYNDARDGVVGFVRAVYAKDLSISGGTMRGQDSYSTASRYTDYAVKATDSQGVSLGGGLVVRGVNLNAVSLTRTTPFTISGVTFAECGSAIAAGDQGANVLINDTQTQGLVAGNHFYAGASSVPYAIKAPDAARVSFDGNFINYPSATIASFAAGDFLGNWQRSGAVPRTFGTTISSGAAAPTSGYWDRGSVVLNTAPSAAGVPGWVCVTAGTPGTWKAMAVLAP